VCSPPESAAPAGHASPPDLGAIVRRHGASDCAAHPVSLLHQQVLRALASCRTAALGGHLDPCDRCGHRRAVYHSCRNRHCPKCQLLAQEDWLAARETREIFARDPKHLGGELGQTAI